jgi:ubiquinone/menaquinone biosynthesis C-methylase UbiE
MVEVLQSKVKKTGLQAHMSTRQAVAEQLAAEETAVFDTIVDTFGLCSVDDPVGVLQGCARLLKDDGTVLLLEHGRGDWPLVNKLLDARASAHAREWGCWFVRLQYCSLCCSGSSS